MRHPLESIAHVAAGQSPVGVFPPNDTSVRRR
jgi:hypothetical protein